MKPQIYDVVIVGAGAVGCALARELVRHQLDVLVLEAADDVATGATRANSGIVHGAYSAKAGTLKAEYCRQGNPMFTALARELDIPFRRCGAVVLAFDDGDFATLEALKANGEALGETDLGILFRDDLLPQVPRLNPETVKGALVSPGAGIVSPYEYAVALMENALANGAELRLESPLTAMSDVADGVVLEAGGREYRARFAVNAAGSGAGDVARLAGSPPFTIRARKGQYIVFRRGSADGLDRVVFQPPGRYGKGILVTPTTWSNLMLGPDAQEVADSSDLGTDPESLAAIVRTARRSVSDFDLKAAIRVFSGNRPVSDRGDFIIGWSESLPGLLHLAGIDSPGLTASPAIALEAVRMLSRAGLTLRARPDFRPERRAAVRPGPLMSAAAAARLAERPPGDPERLVCRCEQVSEAAIRDVLARGIPIRSLDAVKRRTRAGMGACQGAFCGSRVRELAAGAAGIDAEAVAGPSRDRAAILADLDAMRRILAG